MGLGGLWHGAAWTFVVWGLYQGALLAAHRICTPLLVALRRPFGAVEHVWTVISIVVTFQFVSVGWLIFRANSVDQVVSSLRRIVFEFGEPSDVTDDLGKLAFYVAPLLIIQLAKEVTGDMHVVDRLNWWSRGILYLTMAVLLATAGASGGRTFIYFQF
jgi:alginate O-acetyltransferase complex protein AlgI